MTPIMCNPLHFSLYWFSAKFSSFFNFSYHFVLPEHFRVTTAKSDMLTEKELDAGVHILKTTDCYFHNVYLQCERGKVALRNVVSNWFPWISFPICFRWKQNCSSSSVIMFPSHRLWLCLQSGVGGPESSWGGPQRRVAWSCVAVSLLLWSS